MDKAGVTFNKLEKGILKLIQAADVYALHIVNDYQKKETDKDVINRIIFENKISGLNLFGWLYKDEVYNFIRDNEHFRLIGEQILLATYTALEVYLIDKFKEYFRYNLSGKDDALIENTLKKLAPRGLSDIKRNYYDLLQIHLPSFEIESYNTDERSHFKPKASWEAIKMISKARNEIAHYGKSLEYKIVTLMDSWYPFDFVRRWVSGFDVNFDYMIYKKYDTSLIRDYKERLSKIGGKYGDTSHIF